MISDWNYKGSFLNTMNDYLLSVQEKVQMLIKTKTGGWLEPIVIQLRKLMMVAASYLDLTLDSILLWTVVLAIGSTFADLTLFSSQIVLLLLVSIIIPNFLTAIIIASTRPFVVLNPDQWIKWKISSANEDKKVTNFFFRLLITLLFPFVPAIIMVSG